jgi:hypothetical protein
VLPIMRGKPVILATVDDIQAASIEDQPDLVAQIIAEVLGRLGTAATPTPSSAGSV